MSPDSTAQIAALGIEPTYSAREAAVMLGRSYSWLGQGLRDNKFTLPDDTPVQPRRTSGMRWVPCSGARPGRCSEHGNGR
jgi:hypothetical protein